MQLSLKYLILFLIPILVSGQTELNLFPDSIETSININLKPGVFYVPKTATAASDFVNNGITQNCIRTKAF